MLRSQPKTTWTRRSPASQGFTLIELLVVIAITTVLLLLLFGPLVTGFQLTATAQTTTEAQDAARVAMEQISRELASAAGVRDTTQQYLDLLTYTSNTDSTQEQVAHAYNAYLDIIPPQPASNGNLYDPTMNPGSGGVTVQTSTSGTTILAKGPALLPLGPSSTIIRYFIGLRRPINLAYTPNGTAAAVEQPYTNRDEHQLISSGDTTYAGTDDVVAGGLNNPYILYRAEVQPYTLTTTNGTTTSAVNTKFFAAESTNANVANLDDPDFFRVINPGDSTTDPDNPQGLTPAEITAHNQRVYYWYQNAKPIINISDVNLIFQPHNADGTVIYGGPNGTLNGTQLDSTGLPILRTSVSFQPASVAAAALAPAATSDVSQGYGTSPADAIAATGPFDAATSPMPYIPSVYQAKYGQWEGDPNITVTSPANAGAATPNSYLYTTYVAPTASGSINANDLVEAVNGTPVWDVSQAIPIPAGNTNYLAMTYNGDAGTVNFALPDVPPSNGTYTAATSVNVSGSADPGNASNPYWFMQYATGAADLQIHVYPLSASDPDALGGDNPATEPMVNQVTPHGRIVVNSERVYGPEQEPGPGSDPANFTVPTGNPVTFALVPYHRVPFNIGGVASIGYDQYMIDYNAGIIYLGSPGHNIDVSSATANYPQRRTVLVAFSYQNNLGASSTGVYTPDTVTASYQSGNQISVAIGIRLYDPSNQRPTYFSLTNNVAVGNASQ